jgi:hypothetical protein
MKKIYLSILGVTAFAVFAVGQTTLNSTTNAFKVGDSHEFIITTPADEGQSGEKVIWDFTNLQPTDKTLTSHMIQTSESDKSSLIPEANLILEEYGNLFFFKVTSNGMEQYGVSSCNAVTKFDKPFVKLKFPFKYGDKVAGNYSGSQTAQNSSTSITGTYEVIADAYGTMLLPNNISIENALRVKQTRTYLNSDQKEVTYRWYAAGVRYPILTVIKYVSPQQTFTSQTALFAHATSQKKSGQVISNLADLSTSNNTTTYPNPYTDELKISYNVDEACKVTIDVFNVAGKKLETVLNQNNNKGANSFILKSNEYNFQPGVYYIRVNMGDKSTTSKVVKLK